MIKIGANYLKLKTKLHLACNRLKIVQAKESELICRQRREIEDYLKREKYMQAKIKILTILREEAFVEAMELIEIFCNELSSRFDFLKEEKELDEKLEEAVSSLIWVAPFMQSRIPELKHISKQLTAKFGRSYSHESRKNKKETVCPELIQRLQLKVKPHNLTHEDLENILRKYNIPEDKKATFKEYFIEDGSADSRAPPLMKLNTPSTVTVESYVNRTNNGKAPSNARKSFGSWLKKSFFQSISVELTPDTSEGKEDTNSFKNIPLPRNTYNEDAIRNNYSVNKESMVDFSPYINNFSADQHGRSEKNIESILNASACIHSFNETRSKQLDEIENKDINFAICPGKCRFLEDINDYNGEGKNEITSERNENAKANSNSIYLTDVRTAHLNGVIFSSPEINGEITNNTRDREIIKINGKSTYNQQIKNCADANQQILLPSKMDEPPPPYYLFDVEAIPENNSDSQFCNDDIDLQFYPPPHYFPSPSPNCPSDDMHSEEADHFPLHLKSPSSTCPNDKMQSEEAGTPSHYLKSPSPSCPSDEMQSQEADHSAI